VQGVVTPPIVVIVFVTSSGTFLLAQE